MSQPRTVRLRDVDRAAVVAAVAELADDPGAVISVRLEGSFRRVLVRSVPPQDPPYRPYVEVCASDEVRWEHAPFYGVFVGFSFPDLAPGATIPGMHLHGLDRLRTTGGHNHDLFVKDALLSVGRSHDVVMQLPERTMADLLETPEPMRAVQRELLRSGPLPLADLAAVLSLPVEQVQQRVEWLADRGYVEMVAREGGEPAWQTCLRVRGSGKRGAMANLLDSL